MNNAKVEFLMISSGSNYWKQPKGQVGAHPTLTPEFIECESGRGIKGDRFYDYEENYEGQISLFSDEYYRGLKDHLGIEFSPVLFRRNVVVSGINPLDFVGKKLKIGEVEIEGTTDCTPCVWMDSEIANGAFEWLKTNNAGGLRAKILKGGLIRLGDSVSIEPF